MTMTWKQCVGFFVIPLAVILSAGLPASAQAKINTLTPSSGLRGTTIVIAGTGFSTSPAFDVTVFATTSGTGAAVVTSATTSSLSVIVPASAVSGNVFVQVAGQNKSNTKNFTVINQAPVVDAGSAQIVAFPARDRKSVV